MIYQLSVPAVAEDVEDIRILEWHGEPGQAFASGDLIVEFETHKALVEVRAGQAGVMRRVLAQSGEWSAIGGVIALFSDDESETLPQTPEGAAELAVEFLVD
jgi:pyruvate/2-oxoglutarate dehydrogenase complex dihydrolipoamide acyltransferase (E2) component